MVALSGGLQAMANPCITQEARALVAQICRSLQEADDQLTCLEQHFIAHGDRHAIFTSLYALTALRVMQSIDAGAYLDASWVSAYLVSFANLWSTFCHTLPRASP